MMNLPIAVTVSVGLYALLTLFYVLIECAKQLPSSGGRRQQLIDPLRSERKTIKLLYGPPQAIKTVTRLNQQSFKLLLNQLVNKYNLCLQEGLSAAQKLMIFMLICGGGLSMRYVAYEWQHLMYTISL